MPVAVPRLAAPFGTGLHLAAEEAQEATERWARDFGLTARPEPRARLSDTVPARLAGRVSPHATSEGLLLSTDWQTWLFLFDDEYCDESGRGAEPAAITEVTVRLLAALETGDAARGDAYGRALADLGTRLGRLAGPVQRARFVHAVTCYFYALVWEAGRRRRGTLAPLTEYVRMRRHSGAVATCLALIETVNGFEIGDRAWHDPTVRAAADAVADIICWSNDLVSYEREGSVSGGVLSLPTVLARGHGLTPQQALDRCAAMVGARIADFVAAERPLLASGDPALIRFAADLRHWIAGNLEWSYETGRYKVAVQPG